MVRLELLRLNTAPALDPARLADARRSRTLDGRRSCARSAACRSRCCAAPGEPGFSAISWDEALDLAAAASRAPSIRSGSLST